VTETRHSRLYIRRDIKNEFREAGCECVEGLGGIHLAQDTDKYRTMSDRLLKLRVKALIEIPSEMIMNSTIPYIITPKSCSREE